jgi:hypothetical protein
LHIEGFSQDDRAELAVGADELFGAHGEADVFEPGAGEADFGLRGARALAAWAEQARGGCASSTAGAST